MNVKSILIIGNYGAGNLGDDAILGGILRDLKEISYKGEIMIMHGGVVSSDKIYQDYKKVPFIPAGIRSRFNFKQKNAAIAAIKRADMVIFGGGGLFVDSESWKAPYIWYKQAEWCRKLNTTYICYAQSIGPLKYKISKYWARKTFRFAKDILMRDEQSLMQINKWGIDKAIQGTDPAFSYLATLPKLQKTNDLLISIRNWGSFSIHRAFDIIKPICEFAEKNDLKPLLLSMDMATNDEKTDLKSLGLDILTPNSVEEAFQAISKASLVVAMRLHVNIFALFAESPLISLSYSSKVKSFLKSLGLMDIAILEPENWDYTQIKSALEVALYSKPKVNIQNALQTNREFLSKNIGL